MVGPSSSVFYYHSRGGARDNSTHNQWGELSVENELLVKIIKEVLVQDFVRFRVVFPTRPMEYLCMGIKYVYVPINDPNYV